jgi:hypothetical protein
MILKYNFEIDNSVIEKELMKITNQIYKLLPCREENKDWEKPLETIIEELSGINRLMHKQQDTMLPLICKLEGLFLLTQDSDFLLYRRTIFECLSLINKLVIVCQD